MSSRQHTELLILRNRIVEPNLRKLANIKGKTNSGEEVLGIDTGEYLFINKPRSKVDFKIVREFERRSSVHSTKKVYKKGKPSTYQLQNLVDYARENLTDFDALRSKIDLDKEVNKYWKTLESGKKARKKKRARDFKKKAQRSISRAGLHKFFESLLSNTGLKARGLASARGRLFLAIDLEDTSSPAVKELYRQAGATGEPTDYTAKTLAFALEELGVSLDDFSTHHNDDCRRFAVAHGTQSEAIGMIDKSENVREATKLLRNKKSKTSNN